MGNFDLSTSEVPQLVPLKNSFAVDQAEEELRDLICELFETELGEDAYDASAAGAAHLGTFGLVQRAINADGLVLLPNKNEHPATRYIYRAWKAQNLQGRGTAFLRTYLQMHFPNDFAVNQLWHKKDTPYPEGLVSPADTPAPVIDPATMYLTSRLEIDLDYDIANWSIKYLVDVIRAIIPARFVPTFRFHLSVDFYLPIFAFLDLFYMEQIGDVNFQFNGRVITERESALWYLGRDEDPAHAWHMRYRPLVSLVVNTKQSFINYGEVPTIGTQQGRKLDGTWMLPMRGAMFAEFEMKIIRDPS
jgi:hypothetical protein